MKVNHNQRNVTAAYSAALKNARTGGGKLTQEKAGTIAMATTTAMHTDDDKPATFTQSQKDAIKALFHPTRELRIKVLAETLKEVGVTLDDTTLELLTPLLTPANFDKKLKEMKKAPTVDWSALAGTEEEDAAAAETDEQPATGHPAESVESAVSGSTGANKSSKKEEEPATA